MKTIPILVAILIVVSLLIGFYYWTNKSIHQVIELNDPLPFPITDNTLKYIALGDSYTIGESVEEYERWPNLMMKNLQTAGYDIALVANPSRTGWTSRDLIEKQLPILRKSNADIVTILIGVNDWVQGVSKEEFERNMIFIFDEVQKNVGAENIIAISIPDFAKTPNGKRFTSGRDGTSGIEQFNSIVKNLANERSITFVDIFDISQSVEEDQALVAKDGLHPSAKQYVLWEERIRQAVLEKISE